MEEVTIELCEEDYHGLEVIAAQYDLTVEALLVGMIKQMVMPENREQVIAFFRAIMAEEREG